MSKKAFSAGPIQAPDMPDEAASSKSAGEPKCPRKDFAASEKEAPRKPLEFNGDLTLRIPKSLHRKLWEAAILEGVSLEEYIIYKLTQ